MVTVVITIIKGEGASFLLGETIQSPPALHPLERQGGLTAPLPSQPSRAWKGLAFQGVCLPGTLGAISGVCDPSEEPRASAWLLREAHGFGVVVGMEVGVSPRPSNRPFAKE